MIRIGKNTFLLLYHISKLFAINNHQIFAVSAQISCYMISCTINGTENAIPSPPTGRFPSRLKENDFVIHLKKLKLFSMGRKSRTQQPRTRNATPLHAVTARRDPTRNELLPSRMAIIQIAFPPSPNIGEARMERNPAPLS